MSSSSKDIADMPFDEYIDFLYIPLEEIQSATNNFADQNLLTKGTSFHVYQGQLLQSGDLIDIVARVSLHPGFVANELISTKNLKHKNIVSLFKFSETEDAHLIMINKHEVNGSLDKHLSSQTLTWMQRLHICVGVARALRYLHYDAYEDHYFIHGNMKSSKILLDDNWEPKLHGFAFAVEAKKLHLHLTSKYNGALQYMDPAYENTKSLTHKSDVFSFGVLLFEVLFGREAVIPNNDKWYFARLARSHYEEGKLDDLIPPIFREKMNLQSLNIFAETAYCCLKEKRSQRPNMNQILLRLERALELQHKHEHPTIAVEGTSSNHLKGGNLDHLKFRLSDIELATNKFSKTHCIGSGGYGMVYKAELEHFDGINSLVVEGKVKVELSKKRGTVAIKRIFSREDEQGKHGFFAEIEMLSNCKHPNIVSLLGFCDEAHEMLLIYEYVSNRSLDDYLGNIDNMTNLTWAQRIQICLDIAHGLSYLHRSTKSKQSIIHRDIKSANILLDANWVAKIADFGLSKLHPTCHCQQGSTIITNNIAGTNVYLDPEYQSTGKLKTKSDIYSFGVVMFEIMCGKLAYDITYNEEGLPSMVRHCFNEGTLEKLVDPNLKETDEIISMLNGGVNQDSLNTFSKIAYQCLAVTQAERPTLEVIIEELKKALNFQENNKDSLHISVEAIKSITQNFSDCNCIGKGRFWRLYEGEFAHANGYTAVIVKRWDSKSRHGHAQFFTELEILKHKHENIIGLVGYCNEMNEKIIVYEHASNGRLFKHLDNPSLTWMKRLKICIDIANGLLYLHSGRGELKDSVKHRDIKSGSILLDGYWNAKISNLEWSEKARVLGRAEHLDDNSYDSLGYIDPEYQFLGLLLEKSDIYSLGVILVEMLCGRLAWAEDCEDHFHSLGPLAVRHYNENGSLDEMIFEGIKEQIVPQSLTTFQMTTIECLQDDSNDRPSIDEVVMRLTKALELQEDYEIGEPRLPIDYQEIIMMSKAPEIYDNKMKKDIFDMFSKGILLKDGKVWFSLGSNGERNEMKSSKLFSYKNPLLRKWRSLTESRFRKVAEVFNISNLNIQIKIRTQFLSPSVNYKVHLIFRFCGPRKPQVKQMYVNLKYKMGNESLNAYFATWKEDGWMMIEVFRFLNHKKETDFEVLLESFSRCYCGSDSIYIEGVQFQAINDNVKHEEAVKLKDVQQGSKSKSKTDKFRFSPSNMKVKKDQMTWFSISQIKRKQDHMISAKNVVFQSSNVAIQSRFSGAIELQRDQVLHIKCMIKSQMLSSNTGNACYLVFKLSEKCCGLHGPVIVRDLFNQRSKETRILYFRRPNNWNIHDSDSVPKMRNDGWMEVIVWKFDSNYELKNDHLFVNLKLITYEGTMSGLIVRGIKFRPICLY